MQNMSPPCAAALPSHTWDLARAPLRVDSLEGVVRSIPRRCLTRLAPAHPPKSCLQLHPDPAFLCAPTRLKIGEPRRAAPRRAAPLLCSMMAHKDRGLGLPHGVREGSGGELRGWTRIKARKADSQGEEEGLEARSSGACTHFESMLRDQRNLFQPAQLDEAEV